MINAAELVRRQREAENPPPPKDETPAGSTPVKQYPLAPTKG